jgi:hypothetical protein
LVRIAATAGLGAVVIGFVLRGGIGRVAPGFGRVVVTTARSHDDNRRER